MKKMTVEEIKEMVGTEFIYVMSGRAELPAVIAAFDQKIGFTCLATSLVDNKGEDHSGDVDKNGNLCLTGVPRDFFETESDFLKKVSQFVQFIKHTGYYRFNAEKGFGCCSGFGIASCSF